MNIITYRSEKNFKMNSSFKVESGLQLLARLTCRPSLDRLWCDLPTAKLPPGAVIELSGYSGEGKSLLAADAACNVLLPKQYGGCGAGVLIFNTDGNLNLTWLISNLYKKLPKGMVQEKLSSQDCLLSETLKNLYVANVYDSTQLYVTLENLEIFVTDHPNLSLIIFDTLTAFYWSDQGTKLQKMDSYLKTLLKKVQRVTKEHKVSILYVKPFYFGTKQDSIENTEVCVKEVMLEKINCKIVIKKCDGPDGRNVFQVLIRTSEETNTYNFKLVDSSLYWV